MRRLIEEAQAETEQHDKGPLMDVRITAAAQRIEHYEIAACGTIIALAKAAGEQQLADLPIPTLREEKQTDETLTRIAESEINPAAVQRMQPANDARAAGRRSAAA